MAYGAGYRQGTRKCLGCEGTVYLDCNEEGPTCMACRRRAAAHRADRTITAPEGVPVTMRQLVYGDVPDTWEAREALRSVARGGR